MFCDQAKEYLSQKGAKFQERDVAQDPGALADLKKLGYMTTPVIVSAPTAVPRCGSPTSPIPVPATYLSSFSNQDLS
jgi:glutaredoxin